MSVEDKKAAIYAYLCEKFPNSEVEQKYDFNLGAQAFKIRLRDRVLLLKVGDEFVEDNAIAEILRQFNLWSLAEILGKETELGVLATQRGLETFRRG